MASDPPGEAALVDAFRTTRDNRHFEALYRATRRQIFSVCLRILRNPAGAEDATHEAFVKAYERFGSLEGDNFAAWVSRIATNYCLNRLRAESTAARLAAEAAAAPREAGAERAAIAAEEVEMARDVLRSLSPEQRRVLLLRHMEELSHEQIESITGYDAGEIRSHLQNGKRNFRIRWLQRTGEK